MIKHFLAILMGIFVTQVVVAQDGYAKWGSKLTHIEKDLYEITYTAGIEDGWHMYDLTEYDGGPISTSFTNTKLEGVELVGKIKASREPITIYDSIFGMNIGYYEKSISFTQQVRLLSNKAEVKSTVEWMLCNDTGCIAPEEHNFITKIKGEVSGKIEAKSKDVVPVVETPEVEATIEAIPLEPAKEIVESGESESSSSKSLWATIIEAIMWGFAALLTPCVFPMIPMTVSFFMKSGSSPARGRFMAVMYGVFIVALYTLPIAGIILITRVLGGDAVTADIFNWLATHWIPNVIFFVVFMVFAASFFGAFEITMPSWLVNKSDQKADKNGFVGLFFMALTLVLVSFSCTGPIVGSVLIKSTAGEFWDPIITMLAFSTAFALPFSIFAFFPSLLKDMPKSGGWLNSVKVVLGFIEVALGLKFLSVADQVYHWGILDREVYLAIWIVVFSLMGVYLLGKLKLAHDSDVKHVSVKRLFFAMITFSFVVYLIPGMFGAPLKALSGYLPPMHTQDFKLSSGGTISAGAQTESSSKPSIKYSDFLHLPHGLEGFFDYDEAFEYAKSVGKPLFVDITGHGCVNCREMEVKVWSDPAVLSILKRDYVIVALYVDDKKIVDESDWVTLPNGNVLKGLGKINSNFTKEKFKVNSQPHYIVVGADGEQLIAKGYDLNVANYLEFLKKGIELYKK